jgi:hypothetical protein
VPLISLATADSERALGWDRRFADSPLEEAVSSELVSEARFPASREFTENFIDWGLSRGVNASKNGR